MAKKRYTHKQIRHSLKTNELQTLLQRVTAYLRQHGENVLITVIIAGVIAVLVPLYFRHQRENEQRAENLYNRALNLAIQPVSGEGADAGGQAFRTIQEKYAKVQEAYTEVTSTYGRTRVADWARMGEANARFYLQQYDQALDLYRTLLDKHRDDMLAPTLQSRISACLAGQDKWREALENDRLLLDTHPDYFDRRAVRLRMARAYAKLDRADEARKLLEEERQQDPGSFWSEMARQQLVRLRAAD